MLRYVPFPRSDNSKEVMITWITHLKNKQDEDIHIEDQKRIIFHPYRQRKVLSLQEALRNKVLYIKIKHCHLQEGV
jgi:hypothetical protein